MAIFYLLRSQNLAITGKLMDIEGLYKAEGPSSAELANLPPIRRVQAANCLSDLCKDFVFFNHGLLFTEVGMSEDPVEEFMLKRDKHDAVFAVQYGRPLFRGLDSRWDQTWNSIIMGCRRELWPELYMLLNTLVAVNSAANKVYSCFLSNVYMPDPSGWDGSLVGFKVPPREWGSLCENSDRGMSGDARYSNVIFPDYPQSLKIFVTGVSGPARLAYLKSAPRPYVVYSVPEAKTLALQGVINRSVT